ncbi:MAG: hypothetical protein ACI4K9_02615 [Candidatus Fimenecus sp.]
MKKLACLMVVAVLLVVSMVPAFAASGINDYEKKIIDYVQTAYVVDGKTITVPAEYITALENVFTNVDMTEAQYNEVKAILDEALAFVKSKNLQTLEDITATGSTQTLLGYADRALSVVGYHLSTKGSLSDADHGLLIITDANGNVVAELHPAVITKTGADFSSAAFGGVAAVAVLAAAGVAVKRVRKESDED